MFYDEDVIFEEGGADFYDEQFYDAYGEVGQGTRLHSWDSVPEESQQPEYIKKTVPVETYHNGIPIHYVDWKGMHFVVPWEEYNPEGDYSIYRTVQSFHDGKTDEECTRDDYFVKCSFGITPLCKRKTYQVKKINIAEENSQKTKVEPKIHLTESKADSTRKRDNGNKDNLEALAGWLVMIGIIVLAVAMCSACSKGKRSSYYYDSSEGLSFDTARIDVPDMDSIETLGNMPTYPADEYGAGNEIMEDAHAGTNPNDGMFGFDPLDDLDDSYDVERYSEDPYPDEF